ncbi:MAG: phosphotransferase [Deltaproteobacteria bacterium]|nr:phosphotransferase [Deltaproteobacteria bacterium]
MNGLRQERLERYLAERFHGEARVTAIVPLREGAASGASKGYGYGHPARIEFTVDGRRRTAVLETTSPGPFGHEHMADRAQMILWDYGAYNALPRHARAIDVGVFERDGRMISVREAEEFFLLVEVVEGTGYIRDVARLQDGEPLRALDISRADALCDYLSEIHAVRGSDPGLYARRIRELVGHGECVMGLSDSYPQPCGFITPALLEEIERRCVSWRWRLKPLSRRLRQVHGDFHPFNILFREGTDFSVLDRSRGEWGEPADDVTALTGNYLFASLQAHGRLEGAFETLFRRFWERYVERTGDAEILETAAPFFAFRCLVMASPVWYPSLDDGVRRKLFSFLLSALDAPRFDPARVNGWLDAV